MKEFIASYYRQVHHSIGKLTRLTDERELDTLTRQVLADLWERKEDLDAEPRKGIFIYKVVLVTVLAYLQGKGEDDKIRSLRQFLLIDPQNLKPLQDQSLQGDVGI